MLVQTYFRWFINHDNLIYNAQLVLLCLC